MMYDREKSDPAIVAVKPTNKAGQPAAELVEPRAGAEGNVSQRGHLIRRRMALAELLFDLLVRAGRPPSRPL
jgi:hypothetical protein